jgi:integrase
MDKHFNAWAADARRRGLAPRYIAQQQTRVRHITQFAAGRPFDADLIRAWLEHLGENGIVRPTGQRQKCSPKTLNNHLAAMRAYFGWCVDAGLLGADPSAGVAWAKARRRKGRVISARQAWAIFEAAQQDEASMKPRCMDVHGRLIVRSPFYRVLIATGMRAGAAEALRVRDFELSAEPPRIIVRAEADKSGQERSMVISEDDRRYFEAVLKGLPPGAPAVHRPHHKVLSSDARAAGIEVKDGQGRGLGFHCFRRWHGSEMDRQGFSIEQIRQRLGHKTIHSTMGYLVRELEEQQGVAERLSQVREKKSTNNVDTGDRLPDTGSARNDAHTTTDFAEHRGVRSAPVVPSSRTAPTPRDPAPPPGPPPPGRNSASGLQGPEAGLESDDRFKSCRPDWGRERGGRVDLLHRLLDLLDE